MTIDYHNWCDVNTTKEDRQRLNLGDIYSNGVKCLKCGWYLRSRNRHDAVYCKCENRTMVDGGSFYARYGGKDMSLVEPRTIMFSDTKDAK